MAKLKTKHKVALESSLIMLKHVVIKSVFMVLVKIIPSKSLMSSTELIPDVSLALDVKNHCGTREKVFLKDSIFYLHARRMGNTSGLAGVSSSSGSTSSNFFFNISSSNASIRLVLYLNHSSEFTPRLKLFF